MRLRCLHVVAVLLLLVLGRAHAQAPQPAFRVEVNVVEVDVSVTDDQGDPVPGLTVDDFELIEDGQPQKVQSFSYVDIPLTPPVQFQGAEKAVSTDVRSNREPVSGRTYLIVLDDMNISPLRIADVRTAAREFIESYIGAGDLAAVVYTSGRLDASQDFTNDAQLLLASIDKFMGRGVRSTALEASDKYYEDRMTIATDPSSRNLPEDQASQLAADQQNSRMEVLGKSAKPTVDIRDFERAQRVITVLDAVKELALSVSNMRGRRKAIVMFSEGLNYQLSEPFGMRSVSDVLRATQETLNAAARSNVSFYTIDPRGLVGAGTDFMQMGGAGLPDGGTQVAILDELKVTQDSLRVLADETGGFAVLNANSFASAFDRIVESNSQYYVLAYTPPAHSQDGRFHEIQVRVKRPGVKVTARRGYASPSAQTLEARKKEEAARRARDAKRPDADTTSTQLRAVLDGAIQQSGLTFSVQAAPFRSTDKEASVAISIEIDGDDLPLSPGAAGNSPSKLEISFYGVNEQGRAGAGVRKELDLAMRQEAQERVRAHGIRLNPRMPMSPGRYRMRVGVRETAGGRSGSVFYDFTVPDFRKDALAMSGLLVTSVSAQQTPTAEPDPAISKLLPGAPTSRRDFPVDDTLAVYSEVYDNSARKPPALIEVLVRVIADDGSEVFSAKDSIAGGKSEPSNIFAQFALKELPPGSYLLRVEAKLSGSDETLVFRETLITVVP